MRSAIVPYPAGPWVLAALVLTLSACASGSRPATGPAAQPTPASPAGSAAAGGAAATGSPGATAFAGHHAAPPPSTKPVDGASHDIDHRVAWASRAAGPGVPVLRSLDPGYRTLPPGGQIVLRAAAPAGARVQFRSFDSGRFVESGQTIAQVRADADGVACATFEAIAGVTADVHLVVSSPDASDRLEILLTITEPTTGSQP